LYGSWVGKELYEIRNSHQSFYSPLGTIGGMAYTAFSCFLSKGREPWTFYNQKTDAEKTEPAKLHSPIIYPKPDAKLSFDLLTNLQRANTNHEHDQPSHLVVKPGMDRIPSTISITEFAGPEQRFCPAGVYEYSEPDPVTKERKLVINAQNCVHCKTCSIKTPQQFIQWTVPEGGGGPSYTIM
jgi:electron-transferring-flavoprotein dehydrogenase